MEENNTRDILSYAAKGSSAKAYTNMLINDNSGLLSFSAFTLPEAEKKCAYMKDISNSAYLECVDRLFIPIEDQLSGEKSESWWERALATLETEHPLGQKKEGSAIGTGVYPFGPKPTGDKKWYQRPVNWIGIAVGVGLLAYGVYSLREKSVS